MFKQHQQNQKKVQAEQRLKNLISSIDTKMQHPYWDAIFFDDEELQILANFGETIKFPHAETAPRVASVLATFVLKKAEEEENPYD